MHLAPSREPRIWGNPTTVAHHLQVEAFGIGLKPSAYIICLTQDSLIFVLGCPAVLLVYLSSCFCVRAVWGTRQLRHTSIYYLRNNEAPRDMEPYPSFRGLRRGSGTDSSSLLLWALLVLLYAAYEISRLYPTRRPSRSHGYVGDYCAAPKKTRHSTLSFVCPVVQAIFVTGIFMFLVFYGYYEVCRAFLLSVDSVSRAKENCVVHKPIYHYRR